MVPLVSIMLIIIVLKVMDTHPVLGVFIAVIGWLILIEVSKKSKAKWTDTFCDIGVLCMFVAGVIGVVQIAYSIF
jgi:hypothetical protein